MPHFNALFPKWTRAPTIDELEGCGFNVLPLGQTAVSAFIVDVGFIYSIS